MVTAMLHRTLLLAAGLLVAAAPSFAQPHKAQHVQAPKEQAPKEQAPKENGKKEQPQKVGGAQSWTAYTYAEGKGKVCYLVGEPAKKEPAAAKRDRVNALVTHNTNDKSSNVVSFIEGYSFPEHGSAELDVDGKKFSLFTDKDTAWARDSATDKAIVTALSKGKQAVLKGSSARGTATTDTYSLGGFAQALALIDKACSVKR
jgi:hypothetical protein